MLRSGFLFKSEFSDESQRSSFGEGPKHSERCERRTPISFPLVVCGLDENGRLFSELTSTLDVSRSGCRLHLHTRPQVDSALALKIPAQDGPAFRSTVQILFQVAWMRPEEGGWAVGAFTIGQTDLLALTLPSRRA